jgi:uncharacterized protein
MTKETPKNGLHSEYYDNGMKKSEGKYQGGKKDGKWTSWHSSVKNSEGNYKDGKKDGKWTSWHGNGQIATEQNYKNGKKLSSTSWEVDGTLMSTASYSDFIAFLSDNTKVFLAQSCRTYYYNDGQKHYEFESVNGIKHGKHRSWYQNGQLEHDEWRQFGSFRGKQLYWYDNGQLESERNYVLPRVSSFKWKDKTSLELSFENNESHQSAAEGLHIYYFKNGYKRKQTFYKPMWEKVGTETYWHSNGKISNEWSFKNGKMHGTHTEWDKKGNVISTCNY